LRVEVPFLLTAILGLLISSMTGWCGLVSVRRTDVIFPGVGTPVRLYPNGSISYVNYTDHFYVRHGWVTANWSTYGADVHNAFLDPAQTNFTLATNASGFLNPSLTQFTNYDSSSDEMVSLFWFQFLPRDLAPGAYSFTGTWSIVGAANPPNYTMINYQNMITLIVESQTFVSCSPNPASIGSFVTCTANVAGSNPTGSVVWSTSSGTGAFSSPNSTLLNGTCSTKYSDNFTGYEVITASYGGDALNNPSTGNTVLIIFVNLNTGTNVTVHPADDLSLTFQNVSVSGNVTANKTPVPPAPAPPLNNTVAPYLEVKVNAGYSGSVTVSVSFDGSNMTQQQKSNLRMLQYTPLLADMSGATPGVPDGVVNMRDIAYIIAHFATTPNSTNWDPRCDIYGPTGAPDGVVNMRDIAFAVASFNQVSVWIDITSHVDTTNNIVYGQTTHFSFIGIH
jgi:hypothetical protein